MGKNSSIPLLERTPDRQCSGYLVIQCTRKRQVAATTWRTPHPFWPVTRWVGATVARPGNQLSWGDRCGVDTPTRAHRWPEWNDCWGGSSGWIYPPLCRLPSVWAALDSLDCGLTDAWDHGRWDAIWAALLLLYVRRRRLYPWWDLGFNTGLQTTRYATGLDGARRVKSPNHWPYRLDFDSQLWRPYTGWKIRSCTHYRKFRRARYPLGSGGIKSSHKFICHVRLKRLKAWWYESNNNHMLALRYAKCNSVFNQVFAQCWQEELRV